MWACHLQRKVGETELQFIARPVKKDGCVQELERGVKILGRGVIFIGEGDYLIRISSPNAVVIGGDFRVTKVGLLDECRNNGCMVRTCLLEDGMDGDSIAFDLTSTQRLSGSASANEEVLRDLERHGVGVEQERTNKTKPEKRDSGYSERSSEELIGSPTPETPPRRNQYCEDGSPSSLTSSDDDRDIYRASSDEQREKVEG